MMNSILANAGLADVAFAQGLVALAIAGVAFFLGISALVSSLRGSNAKTATPVILGVLGLMAICVYAAWYWKINGSNPWELAGQHPTIHDVLGGLPFLINTSAIAITLFRRR